MKINVGQVVRVDAPIPITDEQLRMTDCNIRPSHVRASNLQEEIAILRRRCLRIFPGMRTLLTVIRKESNYECRIQYESVSDAAMANRRVAAQPVEARTYGIVNILDQAGRPVQISSQGVSVVLDGQTLRPVHDYQRRGHQIRFLREIAEDSHVVIDLVTVDRINMTVPAVFRNGVFTQNNIAFSERYYDQSANQIFFRPNNSPPNTPFTSLGTVGDVEISGSTVTFNEPPPTEQGIQVSYNYGEGQQVESRTIKYLDFSYEYLSEAMTIGALSGNIIVNGEMAQAEVSNLEFARLIRTLDPTFLAVRAQQEIPNQLAIRVHYVASAGGPINSNTIVTTSGRFASAEPPPALPDSPIPIPDKKPRHLIRLQDENTVYESREDLMADDID